jgi:hypothetical protein
MIKRVTIFLILIVLVSCQLLRAQGYVEGFVVKNDGDTLKGFINDKGWTVNPTKISFKKALADKDVVSFNTSDLKSLKTANSYFISKKVEVDRAVVLLENEYQNPPLETAVLFLKVLLQGEPKLYYLKESNDKLHFFLEDSKGITELYNRKVEKMVRGYKTIYKDEVYKRQLSDRLSGCPTLSSVYTTEYSEKGMMTLFNSYYGCTSQSSTLVTNKKKTRIELGLLAGVSYTHLKFDDANGSFSDLTVLDLNSLAIPVGLSLEVVPPAMNSKLSFCLETFFMKDDFKDGNRQFKASYIRFNPLVRYYFSQGKVQPFANGGFLYSIAIDASGVISTGNPNYNTLNTTAFGINGGMGARLNKITMEARYVQMPGFSTVVTLGSTMKSFLFLVTYKF